VRAAAASGVSVLTLAQGDGEEEDDLLVWCSGVEEEKRRLDCL
jgi:hypothetical protein